jgi:5-methylcytosine-specific restriction endonuclease McrA
MVIYNDYLKTGRWAKIRQRELSRAHGCCELCGAQPRRQRKLHVHHLTYDRLGNEPSEDLIVLCWSCHQDAHEFGQLDRIQKFAARRQLQTQADEPRTEADRW